MVGCLIVKKYIKKKKFTMFTQKKIKEKLRI